jgi:replicative DNA helicase
VTNLPLLALRAIMTKRGWFAFGHLLKPETFGELEYRRVYAHLARLHEQTESDITIPALLADIEIQYRTKPDTLEEMRLVLDYLDEAVEVSSDLMESLLKRFLQQAMSMEVAKYVAETASKPEFSVAVVADLAARAVEVGERVGETVTDLLAAPLSGSPDVRPARYSLGVSRELDSGLRGGTAGGELCLYLAAPSVGKTSFLCHTGAQHALRGRNVLHVTLEINQRKVFERYDQSWTALDQDGLETPHGQQAVEAARAGIRASGAHVWVADWSYMTVTASDIGAVVRRMRGQKCKCHDLPMRVDTIIVDYMGLMSPGKVPGKEVRHSFRMLGQEMRQLARNLEVPIISAWQVNRVGSEKDLIGPTDISESWDVVMIADTIIGLNRNLEELHNKRLRVNIVKQRESTNRGMFELYCDLDRMVIRDIDLKDHHDYAVKLMGGVNAGQEATHSG